MNKQYFIVEYSEDGTRARRVTGFYSYSVIEQKAGRFSPLEQAYIEIENTDEDFYGLKDVEMNKWVDLPKPRF